MNKTIVLYGDPRTKKNSQRICVNRHGGRFVLPSTQFVDYEESCVVQLKDCKWRLAGPLNLKCVYYMDTRRRVDLCNLLEGTCDILTKAEVITDDNSNVVAGHDGSRVRYDKENPRCEIEIEEVET